MRFLSTKFLFCNKSLPFVFNQNYHQPKKLIGLSEILSQQRCHLNHQVKPDSKSIGSKSNPELIRPVEHLLQNGTVLVSKSNNIFDNLALEEWIYRNFDFSQDDRHLLLMWHNKPTVVVGRHQNVWSEVMVEFCENAGVQIARRNSGGGTVYHDRQNLNISFMTSKKCYNRKRNLSYISEILRTGFAIETEINAREDLIICDSGEKVSGTASKLNSYNSYHHCTLLVDVDRDKLRQSLRPKNKSLFTLPDQLIQKTRIESNATKSVPSPILNLKTLNDRICIDSLIDHLASNFSTQIAQVESTPDRIIELTHSEIKTNFQTIGEIKSTFESWNWRFGKTPKFSVITQFSWRTVPDIELMITVEKGLIKEISIVAPSSESNQQLVNQIELNQFFVGTKFDYDEIVKNIKQFRLHNNQQANNRVVESELIDTLCLAIFNCFKFCVS